MPSECTPQQREAIARIKKGKNHYETLNIKKNATRAEIRQAYKQLAKQLHPDKNKCPGAEDAFKIVDAAYKELTEKRTQYDHLISDESDSDTKPKPPSTPTAKVYKTNGGTWKWTKDAEPEQKTKWYYWSNFYHYYLGFILIIIWLSLNQHVYHPSYSLEKSWLYPVLAKTNNLGIPYYLEKSKRSTRWIEEAVEKEYLSNLKLSCDEEIDRRDFMLWKARYLGDRKLIQEAHAMKMGACVKFATVERSL